MPKEDETQDDRDNLPVVDGDEHLPASNVVSDVSSAKLT